MTTGADREQEGAASLTGTAVTAIAVSPSFARDRTVFAAATAGLHCSTDAGERWRQLGDPGSAGTLTAVAVSPGYDEDGLVLAASIEHGIWRVTRDGASWTRGELRQPRVDIAALVLSPEFAHDGVAFAATMADGVVVSRDRGSTWEASRFGLLDLDVTALAVSPAFARDETVFAATATGIFRSPNGGRAWREVGQPAEGGVVQALAISPAYATDGVLYAGTEQGGLFRSEDRGVTWQPAGPTLRDACVNALVLSPRYPEDQVVILITESMVYLSQDGGRTWSREAGAPAALCLAIPPAFAAQDPVLVGLAEEGMLRLTQDLREWK
jgi:photosystem II stability/assembly factor-like uncharacterized protein